ncbi:MAG: hypothetical protein ACUVTD_08930 [Nitrososphaerales archaeon]
MSNLSNRKAVVEKVISILKNVKGFHAICELDKEDCKAILELEMRAEKCVLGGLGRGFNAGMREVVKREVVLAVLHDKSYVWPPEKVQIICMGEVIGEEIRTEEELRELKERKDVVLLGDTFMIYRDKVSEAFSQLSYFLFPPLSVPELKDFDEIYNAVAAMPSPPVDIYIKEKMRRLGIDVSRIDFGTEVIGFNIC